MKHCLYKFTRFKGYNKEKTDKNTSPRYNYTLIVQKMT